MSDISTERLRLIAMRTDDAEELFPIFADPTGWWYDPDGRHLDVGRSRLFCERAAARWDTDGLSYWTARDLDTDEVVGLGGAQRHVTGTWNLHYRIASDQQGRGLASELARAAQQAAADRDATVAFVAWVAERNAPSRRVAERLGLVNRGPRIDGSDGQVRLAYSDRPLD